MGDQIQFVKDSADYQGYYNSNQLFVLYFTASWCGPCQALKPQVEQLYKTYANVEVVKIDINANGQLAQQYGITSVPTLIFFRNQKKIAEVKGANARQIEAKFEELSKLEPNAVRKGSGSGSGGKGAVASKSEIAKQVKKFVPAAGYEILNSSVDFSDYEALNFVSFNKKNSDSKLLLKLTDDGKEVTESTLLTDADSQGIIYISFLNTAKLYSILLKLKPKETLKFSEESEISADDAEELQPPKTIKIWKNLTSAISFDDANSAINYDHIEEIDASKADADNWYEIKLKFVKFQNVKSISVFIEGDDEDYHTLIDKIVIVGISGEARSQQTLPTGDEE